MNCKFWMGFVLLKFQLFVLCFVNNCCLFNLFFALLCLSFDIRLLVVHFVQTCLKMKHYAKFTSLANVWLIIMREKNGNSKSAKLENPTNVARNTDKDWQIYLTFIVVNDACAFFDIVVATYDQHNIPTCIVRLPNAGTIF